VDVTAQWARKLAAIRAHRSQRPESWVALTERQCGLHAHRYAPLGTTPEQFYVEGFKRIAPLGFIAPTAYLDS
jgi:LmbE family N-acetylglucosaminyl deacetylase